MVKYAARMTKISVKNAAGFMLAKRQIKDKQSRISSKCFTEYLQFSK